MSRTCRCSSPCGVPGGLSRTVATPSRRLSALTACSVLEQSLRYGSLEARRTAFSVALAIFRRLRGDVQQPRTVTPGHDQYYSGLRDRPEGPGCRHRRRVRLPPHHPAPVRRRRNVQPVRPAQTCPSRSRPSSRRAVNTGLAAPSRTSNWTALPSGRRGTCSGPHHHVLDPGGSGEPGLQLPGEGCWAQHADVQHYEVPAAGPSRTMASPSCGCGGPVRVTGARVPFARTRNSRSLPAGMPGSSPSLGGWRCVHGRRSGGRSRTG